MIRFSRLTTVVVALLTSACAAAAPSATNQGTTAPAASPAAYGLGGFPEAPTRTIDGDTATALQAIVDAATPELPGVSATVIAADRGTWTGVAGMADEVNPIEPSSQFEIGSIAKTFIAAEVMRLVEQGRLRLSDPVSDRLPPDLDFDTNGTTIEDLLSMRSGIPDPALLDGPVMVGDPLRDLTAAEMLVSAPAFRNNPGASFSYSNTNYILLGLVIEQVTGTSVARVLRSHQLAGDRFATIVHQPEEKPAEPLALPFLGTKPIPIAVGEGSGNLSTEASASAGRGEVGSMASDSPSLALWAYDLFGRDMLRRESLAAMTDFGSEGYGMGVFDLSTPGGGGWGRSAIGNGGLEPRGYTTLAVVLPGEGVVITVMTNKLGEGWYLAPLAQDLADAVLGH
jgi:D-alanyl-D-alanine carboxypeptidase